MGKVAVDALQMISKILDRGEEFQNHGGPAYHIDMSGEKRQLLPSLTRLARYTSQDSGRKPERKGLRARETASKRCLGQPSGWG